MEGSREQFFGFGNEEAALEFMMFDEDLFEDALIFDGEIDIERIRATGARRNVDYVQNLLILVSLDHPHYIGGYKLGDDTGSYFLIPDPNHRNNLWNMFNVMHVLIDNKVVIPNNPLPFEIINQNLSYYSWLINNNQNNSFDPGYQYFLETCAIYCDYLQITHQKLSALEAERSANVNNQWPSVGETSTPQNQGINSSLTIAVPTIQYSPPSYTLPSPENHQPPINSSNQRREIMLSPSVESFGRHSATPTYPGYVPSPAPESRSDSPIYHGINFPSSAPSLSGVPELVADKCCPNTKCTIL